MVDFVQRLTPEAIPILSPKHLRFNIPWDRKNTTCSSLPSPGFKDRTGHQQTQGFNKSYERHQ